MSGGGSGVCAKREKFFVQGIPLRNDLTNADTWGGGRGKIADTWLMDGLLIFGEKSQKTSPNEERHQTFCNKNSGCFWRKPLRQYSYIGSDDSSSTPSLFAKILVCIETDILKYIL